MKYFTRIQVAPNFYLDEFVDPHTYFTRDDHGLSLVDPRLFKIAQTLRLLCGHGLRINHWWWMYERYKTELSPMEIVKKIERSRSCRKWSGIRTNRSKVGAKSSAHRLMHSGKGLAIDVVGDGQKLFDLVKKHAKQFYKLGLRRLEDPSITPTWLHMDLLERNTQPNSIRVVDRKKATETIRWAA